MVLIVVLVCLVTQGCAVGSTIWLSIWSDAMDSNPHMEDAERNKYLGVYGGIGVSQGKKKRYSFVLKKLNYEFLLRF